MFVHLVLAQALAAADPAAALPAGPPAAGAPPQAITVTGHRVSGTEVGAFVATVASETGNERVARWAGRICLDVAGAAPAQADYLSGRIAAVARQLELEIAAGRACAPAALIVFTADPARLLAELRQSRPRFFGAAGGAARDSLLAADAPVRWLSSAALRGAQGETPFAFYVDPKSGGVERPVPGVRAIGSRLAAGSRMDLQSMLVLVDTSRLGGISNRSLAAYLAMVVLGNIRQPPGPLRQPSILNLFDERARDGGVRTAGLTRWDLAYLRSLHAGNWNMAADRRRRLIAASMARELGARR